MKDITVIDIYCDCASLAGMKKARANPLVRGFTTNPSLIRAAGVNNYKNFCEAALDIAAGLPISFEVFSDDFVGMEYQAREISNWGDNVNVKIPITNTKGESSLPLIRRLSNDGIVCNVTAVFTLGQAAPIIALNKECIISVFAGRIADTGVDPSPIMKQIALRANKPVKILWASPRQVLDITLAERAGADIITVTPELLAKYELSRDKDLLEFSRETVSMFHNDAVKAGYVL